LLTDSGFYDYSGVLHIHSRYSDGTGSVEDIIKAAKAYNLDYIIITDHNNLQAMKTGVEGWRDNMLVLVGEEIGKHGKSHYLAFGIKDTIKPKDHKGSEFYIQSVKDQDGIGFVAHPIGINKRIFKLHLSSWNDWNNPDYTGLEIWSYMRDWAGNVNLFNIIYYYFRPEEAIRGPNPELLKKWDQLCQTRRIAGIGGVDVHAKHIFPFNFMKFLSYKKAFGGLRTHLITQSSLPTDLNKSKAIVYEALKSGNCFFAHDYLGDSSGFSFITYLDKGKPLIMGEEARLNSTAKLEISSPLKTNLRLLCNGQIIGIASDTRYLTFQTSEKGVYRVEAYIDGKPWLFTNPIYLR
jgi:hypothetical protein